jgi:4-hydroxymandelate oxidase
MKEIRENARKRMKGYCRVCPVCDGRACAGEVPGMGGLGTAASFQSNVEALAGHKFHMRLLHDVTEPDTRIEFLGEPLDVPFLAAPIGGVRFNMGGKVTEAEYIGAVIDGCVEKGTLGCVGDGVPDFIHVDGYAAIKNAGGRGIPFIKPWEDKELYEKLERAESTGASMVGMDIDAAGLVTLRKMGRPVSPKSPQQLKKIIDSTSMKFILKGVMTPDDAKKAVDAGVDAIVVSNHGGRVLDHLPGVADVLARVVAAARKWVGVIADGGVRSGGDVLKLLALGADAVMIGRPFSVAAVGGLKDGVTTYIDTLRDELVQTMVMTGTARCAEVGPSILFRDPE